LYAALKENDFEDLENKLQKLELLYQEANKALAKVAEEIGS
jgi:hypothetical protein